MSFSTTAVGSTSSAKSVTLTNHQSVALTFSSIGVTGPFAISSNTCGASLAAGASCSVGVTFTPTATGAATGTLTFTDSAPNSPQTVSLSGTGSIQQHAGNAFRQLSEFRFGDGRRHQLGHDRYSDQSPKYSPHHFQRRNQRALRDLQQHVRDRASAAGATCAVGVTFSPTATGSPPTGTLSFTDTASNSPQKVSLSGTGSCTGRGFAHVLEFRRGRGRIGQRRSNRHRDQQQRVRRHREWHHIHRRFFGRHHLSCLSCGGHELHD